MQHYFACYSRQSKGKLAPGYLFNDPPWKIKACNGITFSDPHAYSYLFLFLWRGAFGKANIYCLSLIALKQVGIEWSSVIDEDSAVCLMY